MNLKQTYRDVSNDGPPNQEWIEAYHGDIRQGKLPDEEIYDV